MCEYHSGFASTALALLQAFYDDNDFETDEAHQEFAWEALENYTFLYHEVSMQKNEVSHWSCCQMPPELIHFSQNARVFSVDPLLLKHLRRTTMLFMVLQMPVY
jgi:hypothetical protein